MPGTKCYEEDKSTRANLTEGSQKAEPKGWPGTGRTQGVLKAGGSA